MNCRVPKPRNHHLTDHHLVVNWMDGHDKTMNQREVRDAKKQYYIRQFTFMFRYVFILLLLLEEIEGTNADEKQPLPEFSLECGLSQMRQTPNTTVCDMCGGQHIQNICIVQERGRRVYAPKSAHDFLS